MEKDSFIISGNIKRHLTRTNCSSLQQALINGASSLKPGNYHLTSSFCTISVGYSMKITWKILSSSEHFINRDFFLHAAFVIPSMACIIQFMHLKNVLNVINAVFFESVCEMIEFYLEWFQYCYCSCVSSFTYRFVRNTFFS